MEDKKVQLQKSLNWLDIQMTGQDSLQRVEFPLGTRHVAELSCNNPSLMDMSAQMPEATFGQQNWDREWIQCWADVHVIGTAACVCKELTPAAPLQMPRRTAYGDKTVQCIVH